MTTSVEALPPGPKAPSTLEGRLWQSRGLMIFPDNPEQRQTNGATETIGTIASVRQFLKQVDERRRATNNTNEEELGGKQHDEGLCLGPFSRQTSSGWTTADNFSEAVSWSPACTQDSLPTIAQGIFSRQHTPITKQTSNVSQQVTPHTESQGTSIQSESTFWSQATPCNDSPGMNFSRQATPCNDSLGMNFSRQATPCDDRCFQPHRSLSRQTTPSMTNPYNPERTLKPEGPFRRQTTPCNDSSGVAFQPEIYLSRQITPYNTLQEQLSMPEDFSSRNEMPSNDIRGGGSSQQGYLFGQQRASHNEAPVRNCNPNGLFSQHLTPCNDVPGRLSQPQCHVTQQARGYNSERSFNPEDFFVRQTTPYNESLGRTFEPDGPPSRQSRPFNDISGRFLQSEAPFSRQTTPCIDTPGRTFMPQGPFSRGGDRHNDAPRELFQPDATCSPQAFPCGDSPERMAGAKVSFCRQATPYIDAAGRFSQQGDAFSQQTSQSHSIRCYNATSHGYTEGLNSSESFGQQAQMNEVALESSKRECGQASGSQRSVQLAQYLQLRGASTTPSPKPEHEEEDSTSSTHRLTDQLSQAAHSRGMQIVVKSTFLDFEVLPAPDERRRKSHSSPPKIA